MGREVSKTPALALLRRRFEAWRRTGRKGRRIPEPLWRAATELARELGSYRVATTLGLDYSYVRRRVDAQPRAPVSPVDAPPAFVELRVADVMGQAQCVVEFEGQRGKLTIHLAEFCEAQVVALAEALSRPAP
jgi:hypothetical protein